MGAAQMTMERDEKNLDNEISPAQPATTRNERQTAKAPAVASAKSPGQGDTVPGWTIMRPLRMRGLKGQTSETASTGPDPARDVKDGGDVNVTESRGSAAGDIDALHEVRSDDNLLEGEDADHEHRGLGGERGARADAAAGFDGRPSGTVYKVYKRRWFGLVQLALLNIIVSWDWLSFSANSTTASQYYNVTPTGINWLSTGFLFAFVVASPFTVFTLHRGGPKQSIIIASILLLVGNWVRYGATRAGSHGNFGGLMFGQILTGLAQPFVLAAPTRYSDLWFSNRGRVAATAVMSLANPLGGALAQLIDPEWAPEGHPESIPNMVLYISIIATIATVPSFFIPAAPPTPCSASSEEPKQDILPSLKFLVKSPEFYMIMIPYIFYVGLFNSLSSLINQMLQPYSFSETDAGLAGAFLILVGLVAAAITSPIIDRTKSFLLAIKIQVPIIAVCYLAFTWAPQKRTVVAPFVVLSILGAASFSLVPVVLEYLIEITHPVSPEVTSTICWTGGQLLGGIFIIVSGELRANGPTDGTGDDGSDRPPGNMYNALIFQTVLAVAVAPLPLCLGLFGRSKYVTMRRVVLDREAAARRDAGGEDGRVASH